MTQYIVSRALPDVFGGFVSQRVGFAPGDKGEWEEANTY